jgi:predicted metal-dependent phosphoesterase TrpH
MRELKRSLQPNSHPSLVGPFPEPSRPIVTNVAGGSRGPRVRVDLHLHSSASFDCRVPPLEVARRCAQTGLSPIFLTDHEGIDGAQSLLAAGHAAVIGQEILTTEGEMIGLFLKTVVPSRLSPEDTVDAIKGQGGLVYLEHPYDTSRRNLREEAIERIAAQIDIVEVFNGRSRPEVNRLAEELRRTLGVPAGAGSDAHTLGEIGSVYIEMDAFEGPQDFLAKLRGGRVVSGANPWIMAARRLFGRSRNPN